MIEVGVMLLSERGESFFSKVTRDVELKKYEDKEKRIKEIRKYVLKLYKSGWGVESALESELKGKIILRLETREVRK